MKNVVILTGAGISAESGIQTFRGQGGLWENHPVEEVASIAGFRKNPQLVQSFYNQRRRQLQEPQIAPNKAHHTLAAFEQRWKGSFLLVTQNVDDLHDRAGSKSLFHMHGELLKARCQNSNEIIPWASDILEETLCPCCKKAGNLRPHIVWFGEMPLYMDEIFEALSRCDIFISIGTSGNVYPAAGFVKAVPSHALTIELNAESTSISHNFAQHHVGLATDLVPQVLNSL